MRPKKILIALTCVTVVAVALGCFLGIQSKPRIGINVIRYTNENDVLFPTAIVEVMNSGPVGVLYEHENPSEPVILRTESLTGSVSRVFEVAGIGLPTLLSPGSNIYIHVPLPEGTLRWQLRYPVRRASAYVRARHELAEYGSGWGKSGQLLFRLSADVLSTNEGPAQQFWSEVFDAPSGRKLDTLTKAAMVERKCQP